MAVNSQPSLTEFYHNKRILITGASGYIAWNLIKKLATYNCTLVCFSRSADLIPRQKGNASFKFITGSYQDEIAFQRAVKNIDLIFHLASQTSAYEAEKNPLADYEANVRPIQLLLEACRKEGKFPIVVFSGTATQCGMPKELPVDENVIDKPITTYDFNKLQAERWLKFYSRQKWVKGVSLRLTNVYGPGPRSSNVDRGILNIMIKKALKGDELTIYGTGEYIRDYIFIDSVVKALLLSPIYIDKLEGKHFILGSGFGKSIHDAIELVAELVNKNIGNKVQIKSVKPPSRLLPIEFRNFIADVSSLTSLTGVSLNYSLKKGITKTIKFYQNLMDS